MITATFRGGPCAGSREIRTAYDPYDIAYRVPLKNVEFKGLLDPPRDPWTEPPSPRARYRLVGLVDGAALYDFEQASHEWVPPRSAEV